MTLKEQKTQNYQALLKVLGELENLVVSRFNLDMMMKRSIIADFELQTTLEYCSKSKPELVQTTDTGYSVTMISPEAKNEEDPVKDILKLNKVEDILWAKDIVARAFLALSKEY